MSLKNKDGISSGFDGYLSDFIPIKLLLKFMKEEKVRKKEGFDGQKAIIIPRKILTKQCTKNEIMSALYITDIGYYPKAKFHYLERIAGADQHILIYCFEGSGSLKISKNNFDINPGDFFIIPAKIPHTYSANESSPWTIYWIHFKGNISNAIINLVQKQTGGYKGFIQYSENSIQLFNEMYNQMERGYSTDNLMYSNMCLWHFLTSIIYNNKYIPNEKLNGKDEIDRAIDFLSTRIDQTLTLEEIAGFVNLSASHFSYLFKKKTGFSPIEYFNHLKVQKACQYLLFTNLRMKEISLELGISDPYYFSRMFTKVMGIPPSEYKVKRIH
ncbi:MAG: AraC family transcriptional regulator [Ginsengibacter sp.]